MIVNVYSEKLIELENTKNEVLNEVRAAEKEFYASLSSESLNKVSDGYKRLYEVDRLYRQELAAIQEQNWEAEWEAERLTRAINWLKQYHEYKNGWIRQIFFTRSFIDPTERVYADDRIAIRYSENGYIDVLGLTAEEMESVKHMFKLTDKSVITERPE